MMALNPRKGDGNRDRHAENDPYPPPGAYEYRGSFQKGLERWAWFGFAVLDFEGPDVHVRYIDENGTEHKNERIS